MQLDRVIKDLAATLGLIVWEGDDHVLFVEAILSTVPTQQYTLYDPEFDITDQPTVPEVRPFMAHCAPPHGASYDGLLHCLYHQYNPSRPMPAINSHRSKLLLDH